VISPENSKNKFIKYYISKSIIAGDRQHECQIHHLRNSMLEELTVYGNSSAVGAQLKRSWSAVEA
jgi:hypothetical protein